MDFLQAVILSIVEGITEFLPVSSTAHLILASAIMHVSQTEFVKSFEIFIQLGAILAIVVVYFKTLIKNFKVWQRIIVAFIPTAVIGLIFYKIVKTYLLGNLNVTLEALFIGGAVMIILEKIYKEKEHHAAKIEDVTLKQAFLVGICQSISIIPGVSRSAASILGGMFVGLKRTTATEFSFLLAIPTMAAATGLDLVKTNFSFTPSEISLLAVGFVGSFISALLVVRFLISYVKKHNFIPFGIYRMALVVVFWIVFLK